MKVNSLLIIFKYSTLDVCLINGPVERLITETAIVQATGSCVYIVRLTVFKGGGGLIVLWRSSNFEDRR